MGEVYRARDTQARIATSRSRSCPTPSRPTRSASRASSAKRKSLAVAQPSEHRRDLRAREDSDGAPSRWSWSSSRARISSQRIARGPMPLDEALPIARADRRGARSRARAGHRPSRSQAGEHQGARRRHGEGARLRSGEGARSRPGTDVGASGRRTRTSPTITSPAMTQHGRDPRHGGLHGAGAGARQGRSTSAPTSGRSASSSTRC